MPRSPYLPSSEFPYHVSARAHNRDHFPIPIDQMWSLICEQLALAQLLYDFEIRNFLLMPNHFHLMVGTPRSNLSQAMSYFLGNLSKELNSRTGRINQNFGCRHNRSLITSYHYYMNAYKYIYRNPVKAGLCSRVEDYKYSSLQMYLGLQTIKLPLTEDKLLMDDIDGNLIWLNKPCEESDWNTLKVAMRRRHFGFPINRSNGMPHRLETNLI